MPPDESPPDKAQTHDSAERSPTIVVTEEAAVRLREAIDGHEQPVAGIRVAIAGRGPEGFQHSLSLIEQGEDPGEDTTVEAEGLTFFLEATNVEYLDGVRIHYAGDAGGGMLEFENPNPQWLDPVSQKLQELFDTQINPQIAAHGGVVSLLKVDGSTAYIELGGGCVGCGLVDVTLKQGIEVAIKEEAPEITEVVDTTDHAAGTNPYHQPSKK